MVVTSFETLGAKPFPVEGAEEGGNQESRIERVASPYASKMLNLLAFVLAHPPIKCATLHLMLKAGFVKHFYYTDTFCFPLSL